MSSNAGDDLVHEPCPTSTGLIMKWHEAAQLYSATIADLSRSLGAISPGDYGKLSKAAQAAGRRSLEAQGELEAHMAEHGCGGSQRIF